MSECSTPKWVPQVLLLCPAVSAGVMFLRAPKKKSKDKWPDLETITQNKNTQGRKSNKRKHEKNRENKRPDAKISSTGDH